MEERRLILAFALSFAVLLGFRVWTNSRYPQAPAVTQTPAPIPSAATPPKAVVSPVPFVTGKPGAPALAPAARIEGAEQRVEITTAHSEVALTSRGARLLSWKLLDYKDQRGKAVELHPGGNPEPGPLDLVTGRPDIDERLRNAPYRWTSREAGGDRSETFEFSDGILTVRKTISQVKGGNAFRIDAEVKENGILIPSMLFFGPGLGQPTEEEKSLRGYLPPQVVEIDQADQETRIAPSALGPPRPVRARLLAVENRYFAAILVGENRNPIDAIASVGGQGKDASVQIAASLPVVLVVGAKDYDALKSLDLGAEHIVPVGSWLGPIVVPLTRALRAVNARVGNYGFAIILLTIGIAAALAPLRHYAILSSAKMAKVAPQIKTVQERYKRLSLTDPKRQQMQQEIAEVYEKNGIDMVRQTAAGCLPTLLTMPFLFAFYRMLDISVDLKGAPFLWIPDLSLKDPLFITPLLSGLSMIAMQRLMPAPAVDPAQQRMLMMMPIIFSGLFAWAPAGLNLYWFVSNLAAMTQQALAMYFAPNIFPRPKPGP